MFKLLQLKVLTRAAEVLLPQTTYHTLCVLCKTLFKFILSLLQKKRNHTVYFTFEGQNLQKNTKRLIKPALALLPQTKVHQFSPTAAEICRENQSPRRHRWKKYT